MVHARTRQPSTFVIDPGTEPIEAVRPAPAFASLDPVITGFEQPSLTQVTDPSFPRRDVSGFLDPVLTGFEQPTVKQPRRGKPQTFEEQGFVQDFLAQFGVEPSAERVSQEGFQQTGTFDPNSTMGRLGFANAEQARLAQRAGEQFGPLKGAEVPLEGGVVITDQEGNPTRRFFNLDSPEAQQAIQDGRFIQPIVGELSQTLQGGLPGGERFYNVPFEQPPIEIGRALSEFGTPQDYLKGLSDFLDEKVFRDRPNIDAAFTEIDTIKQQFTEFTQFVEQSADLIPEVQRTGPQGEALTPQQMIDNAFEEAQAKIDALRNQIDNEFFTDQRARREFAKARDIIEFDNPPISELPFFGEIEATLQAPAIARQERELTGRFEGLQQPPVSAPGLELDTGGRQDFLAYVGSLNLAPEFQRWLLDNFGRLGGLWRQSGEEEFIPWLQKFLAGG